MCGSKGITFMTATHAAMFGLRVNGLMSSHRVMKEVGVTNMDTANMVTATAIGIMRADVIRTVLEIRATINDINMNHPLFYNKNNMFKNSQFLRYLGVFKVLILPIKEKINACPVINMLSLTRHRS